MNSECWGVWHRELCSGRRRGVRATCWRALFSLIAKPYGWAVDWRNAQYDGRRVPIFVPAVPVLSVGNLTLGGVGKTPMVELLARWYQSKGMRPVIISRGYRGRGGANDEAIELARRLPGIVHLQNRDRAAAARDAVALHGADILLIDDGFQHRRLHRDLDIVLLDALNPFGCDRLFPRGLLRERIESLARAHVIVLTRADAVSTEQRQNIQQRARAAAPSALWLEGIHAPQVLVGPNGELSDPHETTGRRVSAFCGIGNPEGFRHTIESLGCEVVEFTAFDDHHHYQPDELHRLADRAVTIGADWLLCTEKDLVKVEPFWRCSGPKLAAVRVCMELAGPLDRWQRILSEVATIRRFSDARENLH